VSAMVHIYSIGYMHHDKSIPRFFAYLNLFTFSMLMLVTADNFVQMFFGWEGVGLCSYLLVGFWYDRPSANAAAIKAFVVNRVGDFGFALGIMGTFLVFNAGIIYFAALGKPGADLPSHELNIIAACVIGGISIAGGIGSVGGAVLGALFLGIISNALPVINISPFWQMAISGSAIILAVVLNARGERQQGRIILRKVEAA